jgi:hypothetical protein
MTDVARPQRGTNYQFADFFWFLQKSVIGSLRRISGDSNRFIVVPPQNDI